MDASLGPVAYEAETSPFLATPSQPQWHPRWYSEQTAAKIDVAVRAIVDAAFDRAVAILEDRRDVLTDGAKELLQRETLAAADLERYKRRMARPPTGAPAPIQKETV
jgi:cell division protease FtsH